MRLFAPQVKICNNSNFKLSSLRKMHLELVSPLFGNFTSSMKFFVIIIMI